MKIIQTYTQWFIVVRTVEGVSRMLHTLLLVSGRAGPRISVSAHEGCTELLEPYLVSLVQNGIRVLCLLPCHFDNKKDKKINVVDCSVSFMGKQKLTKNNALDIPQLEWSAYMLGAAFPTLPYDHWEVPGSYRGERPASGWPGQGWHQHILLLLSVLKGQELHKK